VDQGLDPGLRDAQLVDGAHRVHLLQKSLFFNMRRVQARLEREAMAMARRSTSTSCAR
jgi:hypothetical protein